VAVLINARQSAAKELIISFDDQPIRTIKASEGNWTFKNVLEKTTRDLRTSLPQGQFFLEDCRTCKHIAIMVFNKWTQGVYGKFIRLADRVGI
jgi:hypothetical protein